MAIHTLITRAPPRAPDNTRPPRPELTRVRDQVQGMNPIEEDREAGGWTEAMHDQRNLSRLSWDYADQDMEDGDGY